MCTNRINLALFIKCITPWNNSKTTIVTATTVNSQQEHNSNQHLQRDVMCTNRINIMSTNKINVMCAPQIE